MPRFFIDNDNLFEKNIKIVGDDVKHISKVLRNKIGDILELSDGKGNNYLCRISSINNSEILTDIIDHRVESDSIINVTLFQALPKLTKMDTIIQKCTEIGITNITPFESIRTIVEIKDEKSKQNKLSRWQKIAFEASKQCKRAVIPKIDAIINWKQLLEATSEYDLAVIAYENETESLKQVLKKNMEARNVCIIIGPEGGFSDDEVKEILSKGVSSVSLGKRILRTETAGMTLLSIIMYELGEMEI